jgi:RimJ/RimL family protein N-acetyltransferase
MSDFPNSFALNTEPLNIVGLSTNDHYSSDLLSEKGYEVHTGLTLEMAKSITNMCKQLSIREYCPRDYSERFSDQASTEVWLTKGRLVFLLLKRQAEQLTLAGYGWSGASISPQVPDADMTFALRIGEDDQRKGLSTPFARLILAGTRSMQSVHHFWLETWQSDAAAVHVYHKLGFKEVAQLVDNRPTLNGETVNDIRLYMKFAQDKI